MAAHFSITITKASDFLRLEHVIRQLLQCSSRTCSFFQSAAYIQLRLTILRGSAPPAAQRLPIATSPFMLELLDDGCTLTIHPLRILDFDDTVDAPHTRQKTACCPKTTETKANTLAHALSFARHPLAPAL